MTKMKTHYQKEHHFFRKFTRGHVLNNQLDVSFSQCSTTVISGDKLGGEFIV